MARGVFSGVVVGTLVAGIGLVALSVVYRDVGPVGAPPPAPAPEAAVEAPGAPGGEAAPGTSEEAAPPAPSATGATVAHEGTATPDAPEMPAGAETAPQVADGLTRPETGAAPAGIAAGGADEPSPEVTAETTTPDVPPQQAGKTGLPGQEPAPNPDVAPAEPAVQATADNVAQAPKGGESPALPSAEAAPDRLAQGAQAAQAAAPAGAETAPVADAGPATPEVQAVPEQVASAPEGDQGLPERPSGGEPGPVMPTVPAPVAPAGNTERQPPAPSQPPAAASGNTSEPADSAAVSRIPGTPAGQIGDMAANVVTGRLPEIGREQVTSPAGDASDQAVIPAIKRNAVPFANPEGRPVMAIMLLDDGPGRRDLGDLKNLPFPISFVVDASAEDASEAIDFYRRAGAEVVLEVPLPDWATPEDVEITLQAYAPLLDQAVAVMIPGASGFQTMGDTARQLAVVLSETGHGLVTLPQGLNTGHKSALKQGVPAGLVFRELDNDGQSVAVMRRFLDNAAFKARLKPGVIMLGHARPETIRALIEWSLGNRAKTVALAPISVVLAAGSDG